MVGFFIGGHSMSEYIQLLKSPKWQRKRLEILKRFNFKCFGCEKEDEELHVHHCWYEKGKKPWEYPDYCYLVLCSDCHKRWHRAKSEIDKLLNVSPDELYDTWVLLEHEVFTKSESNIYDIVREEGFYEIDLIANQYIETFKIELYKLISKFKNK